MIFIESPESRGGSESFEGSTWQRKYTAQLELEETEEELRAYVAANTPTVITGLSGGYNRKGFSCNPRAEGNGIFDVVVDYVQPKPLQFSFQTGGGSEKIEYSRETMHWFNEFGKDGVDDEAPPDFKGGINVTKNSIEGMNIKTAQFGFKVVKSWRSTRSTANIWRPSNG